LADEKPLGFGIGEKSFSVSSLSAVRSLMEMDDVVFRAAPSSWLPPEIKSPGVAVTLQPSSVSPSGTTDSA